MVTGFVANPEWEEFVADDGNTYVDIADGRYYDSTPVDMLLQFRVNDDDSFTVQALEFNGIPQDWFVYIALIEAMYNNFSIIQYLE